MGGLLSPLWDTSLPLPVLSVKNSLCLFVSAAREDGNCLEQKDVENSQILRQWPEERPLEAALCPDRAVREGLRLCRSVGKISDLGGQVCGGGGGASCTRQASLQGLHQMQTPGWPEVDSSTATSWQLAPAVGAWMMPAAAVGQVLEGPSALWLS